MLLSVGKASLRGYVVCATEYNDSNHTKTVLELAEFKNKQDAEDLITTIKLLIKISKPYKDFCNDCRNPSKPGETI
jgi:hypothetical protein